MNKYIIKWHIVISASKKIKMQWKGIDTKIRINITPKQTSLI